ncbi:uncharacterized protein BDZ99DRAFT_504110 [Mytilinidion resinicola]|uniref:Uncharacterized protein n=1 Tax=Mytilinidion resinicola TaxID=574789 RepID=A0A6A6Y265_9PEZI|nr:uncharacterized protein BDZ99DRAFT_504110 [Mytilinidion resinicola]KAF2802094.1 hypothetical protein BDZ99DRAFT_504110 [Mytilinidion resinicola]
MSQFQTTNPAEEMNALGFAGLPADILDLLGKEHLDSPDFFNMRLTCRSVQAKTFHAFGKRYFHHVKFMLSPHSLAALEAISKSEFSSFIRHVGIGLERLHTNKDHTFHHLAYSKDKRGWLKKYDQTYEDEVRKQQEMEQNKTNLKILVKVFRTLPNLKTVGVGGPSIKSQAAERIWDTENMQSWGTEHMLRKLGAEDDRADRKREPRYAKDRIYRCKKAPERQTILYDEEKKHRTFGIVFKAFVAAADRGLKLDLYIPEFWTWYSAEEAIPSSLFSLKGSNVEKALSRIGSLTVNLTDVYGDGDEEKQLLDTWIEGLCRQAKSATSIQLCQEFGHSQNLDYFFKPLAEGGYTQLKSLRVSCVEIELQLLLGALRKLSPTIEVIYLSTFNITKAGYDPIIMYDESYGRYDKWGDVYKLLQDLRKLKTLSLAYLTEYRGPIKEETTDDNSEGEAIAALVGPIATAIADDNKKDGYWKYQRAWKDYLVVYGHQKIVDALGRAIKDNEETITQDYWGRRGCKKFRAVRVRKLRS